jgi:hypothetical protein
VAAVDDRRSFGRRRFGGFWNKVEDFEKRADAQLAKDVTIACRSN